MRDVAIISGTDDNDYTYIDIDIINGEPDYLDYSTQTSDQRAALAVFVCKGAIPGETDFGVSWGQVYSQEDTTIQLSNEIQQQVTDYAGAGSEDNELPQTQYNAQLLVNDEGVGVIVSRG